MSFLDKFKGSTNFLSKPEAKQRANTNSHHKVPKLLTRMRNLMRQPPLKIRLKAKPKRVSWRNSRRNKTKFHLFTW